jgi:transposase
MHKTYPSDITREQFAIIRPELEAARKTTRPRTYDLYDIFCGALYILKEGGQWRSLPSDFPKWRSVHEYFRIWSEKPNKKADSLLERSLKKIGWRRAGKGREREAD